MKKGRMAKLRDALADSFAGAHASAMPLTHFLPDFPEHLPSPARHCPCSAEIPEKSHSSGPFRLQNELTGGAGAGLLSVAGGHEPNYWFGFLCFRSLVFCVFRVF
jgi:hypothetical protein